MTIHRGAMVALFIVLEMWPPAEEEAPGAQGVRQGLGQDPSAAVAVARNGAPSAFGGWG